MTDEPWDRLRALNDGKSVSRREPPIDTEHVVWFFAGGSNLRVWEHGSLYRGRLEEPLGDPPSERIALYDLRRHAMVELLTFYEFAVFRRVVLGASVVETRLDLDDGAGLLQQYRDLGFRHGTPWHASPRKVTAREYLRMSADSKSSDVWTVRVDGLHVYTSNVHYPADYGAPQHSRDADEYADREAAIAAATEAVASRLADGFTIRGLDLVKAQHDNPETIRPRVESVARPIEPDDPRDAVDAAVELLTAVHRRYRSLTFVAELVDLQNDAGTGVMRPSDYFMQFHWRRIGAWRHAEPTRDETESSWDYFVRVYNSITWVLDSSASDDLPMFHCGNVSGGGWSCLEIADDGVGFDFDGWLEVTGADELDALHVFHGGWHHGRSFAFDSRTEDHRGERAIVEFDDQLTELPEPSQDPVVPFGHWLFRRVNELVDTAERNFHDLV